MRKCLGIRLTADEHRRLRLAAYIKGVSVNAFVQKAVMSAVENIENNLDKTVGTLESLLVGVRNGPPGYRRCGVRFAEWLKNKENRALRELRRMLEVIDEEMLRREDFKCLFDWCRKHFPLLIDEIPPRRRILFVEGFMDSINS